MGGLLVHGGRTWMPPKADGSQAVGPGRGPVPNACIDHQHSAIVVRTVRLNHGQGRLHTVASLVKGHPRQPGRSLASHIGLPHRGVAGPRIVWRHPIGQGLCGARWFIHQVGTVVTKSERARVEQLMHGGKSGYSSEEVLFDFVEVRGGVENDQASHFTEMKRRICGRLQRLKDVP